MKCQGRSFVVALPAVMMCCLVSAVAVAETYSITGKVTDTAGHAVPSATVTAKSVKTGDIETARTDAEGVYTFPELAAGDYEVSARAGELQAPPVKVTLAAAETTDLVVSPAPKKRLRSGKTTSGSKSP